MVDEPAALVGPAAVVDEPASLVGPAAVVDEPAALVGPPAVVDEPATLLGPDAVVAIVVPVVGPATVVAVPAVGADVGCVDAAVVEEAAGGIKADSGDVDSATSFRLTSNLSFPFFMVAVPLIVNMPFKVSFSFPALAIRKHHNTTISIIRIFSSYEKRQVQFKTFKLPITPFSLFPFVSLGRRGFFVPLLPTPVPSKLFSQKAIKVIGCVKP